ncbi:40S ribosomal protein S19-3-like protein [Tanacetum coccineum]
MATARTVKDVSPHEFVTGYAAHLKRSGKMELPEWTDIVKTATFKELAPYDPDWSSIARKVYLRGGLGVGAFQRIYGGSKRNGSAPPHFCKASGGIVRHILQQLETMKIIDMDPKGGRRITSSGRRDLDQVAGRIAGAAVQRRDDLERFIIGFCQELFLSRAISCTQNPISIQTHQCHYPELMQRIIAECPTQKGTQGKTQGNQTQAYPSGGSPSAFWRVGLDHSEYEYAPSSLHEVYVELQEGVKFYKSMAILLHKDISKSNRLELCFAIAYILPYKQLNRCLQVEGKPLLESHQTTSQLDLQKLNLFCKKSYRYKNVKSCSY